VNVSPQPQCNCADVMEPNKIGAKGIQMSGDTFTVIPSAYEVSCCLDSAARRWLDSHWPISDSMEKVHWAVLVLVLMCRTL
jgi:hypothetical protein